MSNPPERNEREAGEQSAFASLQRRLQRGDSGAFRALLDDYSDKLVQLAAKNIHPALLRRFDGEDVVQSVFRTFFRRSEQGEFQIERSQQLWQLLVTLTLCKTRSRARKHTAGRRDVRAAGEFDDGQRLLDREPLPEDALTMWEEIDAVLEGLPDRAGEVLMLRLEGRNKTEIAEHLNLSRQTIHRVLKLLQQRLEERFEQFS